MENSILNNCHWGFRSAHSTALALIGIDNGKINSTILLDVKKAFDTIDRDGYRTHRIGILQIISL